MTQLYITFLLIVVDAVAVSASMLLTYSFRYGMGQYLSPFLANISTAIVLTIFWCTVFLIGGLYKQIVLLVRFDEISRLLRSIAAGIIVLFILTADLEAPLSGSRIYLIAYGLFSFIFITVGRMAVREYQVWLRWKGRGMENALIVGYNDVGKKLQRQLENQPVWGFKLIGYIRLDEDSMEQNALILGDQNNLSRIVVQHSIRWLMIAPDISKVDLLSEILVQCSILPVRCMIIADKIEVLGDFVRKVPVHGMPLVEINSQPLSLLTRISKRSVDIVFGFIGSLLFLFTFPIVALLLKMERNEKLLVPFQFIGYKGREFRVYNYRLHFDDNDKPVSAISKLLFRVRIFRLPELFAVLIGKMSLIGPHSETQEFSRLYESKVPMFNWRYKVRPGITGWSQIRYEYDESTENIRERTKYDLYYIERTNILFDLWILLSAIKRLIFPK